MKVQGLEWFALECRRGGRRLVPAAHNSIATSPAFLSTCLSLYHENISLPLQRMPSQMEEAAQLKAISGVDELTDPTLNSKREL